MPVFRVEMNKGLLSQILSLPEYWDYTLSDLGYIKQENMDAIRFAVNTLERAGYIECHQVTNENSKFSNNESAVQIPLQC